MMRGENTFVTRTPLLPLTDTEERTSTLFCCISVTCTYSGAAVSCDSSHRENTHTHAGYTGAAHDKRGRTASAAVACTVCVVCVFCAVFVCVCVSVLANGAVSVAIAIVGRDRRDRILPRGMGDDDDDDDDEAGTDSMDDDADADADVLAMMR